MSYIHPYSYKPDPEIIYGNREDPENTLTFGFELEVDRRINNPAEREAAAKTVTEIGAGRVYCKNDSSLCWGGDYSGFEIVSHPGSLRHICYEMHMTGIINKVRKAGFRSHDAGTCGLHVHVGRLAMGRTREEQDDVIRKVTFLVARHWDDIKIFTRRTGGQLHSWAGNPGSTDNRYCEPLIRNFDRDRVPDDISGIRTHNTHGTRYYAVNCENKATMELRIFRGSLKRDTVIAAIQFASNLVRYAMSHTWAECAASAFTDIAQYEHYRDLDAYLELRGLCADTTHDVSNGGLIRRISAHGGTDGIASGYDAEQDAACRRTA